jgi:hypothetical protein
VDGGDGGVVAVVDGGVVGYIWLVFKGREIQIYLIKKN